MFNEVKVLNSISGVISSKIHLIKKIFDIRKIHLYHEYSHENYVLKN